MAVRWRVSVIILFLATGCAVQNTEPIVRVALLAPFEGRYREVGYDALYAARLALNDSGRSEVDLLAVDDGGSVTTAAHRAQALAADPLVKVVLLSGYAPTSPATQAALDDLPALVIGRWGAERTSDSVFFLSSPSLPEEWTTPPRLDLVDAAAHPAPLRGGEVFALTALTSLHDDLNGVAVVTNAALPDADFTERYRNSDQFAPSPGLLAPLAYDAMSVAVTVAHADALRETVTVSIANMSHNGFNGTIAFRDGYWHDAPIHRYFYENSQLVAQNVDEN